MPTIVFYAFSSGMIAFFLFLLATIIFGPDKPPQKIPPAAVAVNIKPPPGNVQVKILDVRKDDGCEHQTLMENTGDNNYRFTRCGYFGKEGDTFWWRGE